MQLTKSAGGLNSRPSVTSDGRTLVFISSRTGLRQIWRMDTDGGNALQVTHFPEGFEADHPVLSPDDAWIYFVAFGAGGGYLAKIPVSGGEPVRVSDLGWPLSMFPDGKQIVVGSYDKTSPQPWKNGIISVENGQMLKELKKSIRTFADITPDSEWIYVVRDDDASNIWRYPINGGEMRQVTDFDGGVIRDFAISPDFTQIAISRGNPSAEAILITDFR